MSQTNRKQNHSDFTNSINKLLTNSEYWVIIKIETNKKELKIGGEWDDEER